MQHYPFAPELEGATNWIHSIPLQMKDLEDKVVAIEFFSYGCGNCQNAMPKMQKIYEKYGKEGFVLIGVHSPEFESEKNPIELKAFLIQNHLTFPVAVDDDMEIWNAYSNQFWPTVYLLDKQGRIRERHIGEGGYHRLEHDIAHLLHEKID